MATLTNANASTMPIGSAVYSSASGAVNNARANAAGTSLVVGLATADILAAASGSVTTSGPVTATTAQWDAIAGTTGGLTFNTPYYLDPTTAAHITATPPSGTGQYVTRIGYAVSTTVLIVNIQPPIGPLP